MARDPKFRSRAGKALNRRLDYRALKDQYGLTYEQLAQITGYHQVTLKQWGCGSKTLTLRTLRFIRLALEAHERHQITV